MGFWVSRAQLEIRPCLSVSPLRRHKEDSLTGKRQAQERNNRRKPDDPEQYKRFLEAAREAEADESKENADRAFKKVAKPPKRKG